MKYVYVITEALGELQEQRNRAISVSVNIYETLKKYDVCPVCSYIDPEEFTQRFGFNPPDVYKLSESERVSACDYAVFVSAPNADVPGGVMFSISGVLAFPSISDLSDFLDRMIK